MLRPFSPCGCPARPARQLSMHNRSRMPRSFAAMTMPGSPRGDRPDTPQLAPCPRLRASGAAARRAKGRAPAPDQPFDRVEPPVCACASASKSAWINARNAGSCPAPIWLVQGRWQDAASTITAPARPQFTAYEILIDEKIQPPIAFFGDCLCPVLASLSHPPPGRERTAGAIYPNRLTPRIAP